MLTALCNIVLNLNRMVSMHKYVDDTNGIDHQRFYHTILLKTCDIFSLNISRRGGPDSPGQGVVCLKKAHNLYESHTYCNKDTVEYERQYDLLIICLN